METTRMNTPDYTNLTDEITRRVREIAALEQEIESFEALEVAIEAESAREDLASCDSLCCASRDCDLEGCCPCGGPDQSEPNIDEVIGETVDTAVLGAFLRLTEIVTESEDIIALGAAEAILTFATQAYAAR